MRILCHTLTQAASGHSSTLTLLAYSINSTVAVSCTSSTCDAFDWFPGLTSPQNPIPGISLYLSLICCIVARSSSFVQPDGLSFDLPNIAPMQGIERFSQPSFRAKSNLGNHWSIFPFCCSPPGLRLATAACYHWRGQQPLFMTLHPHSCPQLTRTKRSNSSPSTAH